MKRFPLIRMAAVVLGALAVSGTASAYYYYFYFNNGVGAMTKFDLNGLVNNTVPFYISDQGPAGLVAGDSFQAVVSEIRAAAAVWNGVGTSKIRLSYGGLFSVGRVDSSPSIDVMFSDDVPPGLLAVGAPASLGGTVSGPNGKFLPITRSLLLLPRDMTQLPVFGPIPSYSEAFFVTLVHEFGHTLGLQHTLTSGVMSTLTTSASSKASPLAADDIAGISLLYPTDDYLASVGAISGRVTMNGTGLNLASVVAISPSNAAISTLTNPDGTYQIRGIPPGQYFVYVHPLPPPAYGESYPDNIWPPLDVTKDPSGVQLLPNYTAFAAQFYGILNGPGGTRQWQQAQSFRVDPGYNMTGVDFNVSPRSAQSIYSVRMYGYTQAGIYVSPAPVALGTTTPIPLAATGAGLLQNGSVAPGLSINTLGSVAQIGDLQPYPPPYQYIAMYVQGTAFGVGPGPKHLLFSTANDVYLLPSAFTAVQNPPPFISSLTPVLDGNGARAVLVAGTSLTADTRILFDGLAGVIESVHDDGSLVVAPPPAPAGYTASVTALNSDGQSSLFLQQTPPSYSYDASGPSTGATAQASLVVSPTLLVPGPDVTVTITGVNTNFADGQTLVGFGTSDVVVKQLTVNSPTQMTAVVAANSIVPTSRITVTTGLRIISQALGYQVVTTDSPQAAH
jgi:Matrixin